MELRRRIKEKKPDFLRQDAHKLKRLGSGWRKSKGLQSKMRLAFKGYRKKVKVGYGSPNLVNGLSKDGYNLVRVTKVSELDQLDTKKHAIELPHTLGMKRKYEIVKAVKEKGFVLVNYDPIEFVRSLELKKAENKKKRVERAKRRKERESKKKQDAKVDNKKKESKKKEDDLKNSEKKKEEKKEKDKIITKRTN